jgi:hypothetical protein
MQLLGRQLYDILANLKGTHKMEPLVLAFSKSESEKQVNKLKAFQNR